MQIRNSFKLLLQKPIVKSRTYGNWWFTRVAADLSNTLPEKQQEEESLGGFKKDVKNTLIQVGIYCLKRYEPFSKRATALYNTLYKHSFIISYY